MWGIKIDKVNKLSQNLINLFLIKSRGDSFCYYYNGRTGSITVSLVGTDTISTKVYTENLRHKWEMAVKGAPALGLAQDQGQ